MVDGNVPHNVGAHPDTDHVIMAVGAPHKPVDSPERMTFASTGKVTSSTPRCSRDEPGPQTRNPGPGHVAGGVRPVPRRMAGCPSGRAGGPDCQRDPHQDRGPARGVRLVRRERLTRAGARRRAGRDHPLCAGDLEPRIPRVPAVGHRPHATRFDGGVHRPGPAVAR
jgi:hypothetical protein